MNGVQQHVSIVNQLADSYCMKSAKRTSRPKGPTLFSSPVSPRERLTSYVRWHISRSPVEEADFKVAEQVLVEKGFDLMEMQLITSEE